MANETVAQARQRPDAADEDAYQAFCAALSESARGRAFLAEYTRRNRNADTEMLIAALERLEAVVRAHLTPTAGIRAELRALLETIRSARPQIDTRALPARAAKLAGLLDLLERRIEDMVEQKLAEAAPPAEPLGETARAHLAVVEPPDEPELPIPSPASAQPPAIALVSQVATIPEVAWFDSAAPAKVVAENTITAPPALAAAELPIAAPVVIAKIAVAPAAQAAPASADPLAPLMALSEEERIALFT